jgi:hypothetical protein
LLVSGTLPLTLGTYCVFTALSALPDLPEEPELQAIALNRINAASMDLLISKGLAYRFNFVATPGSFPGFARSYSF